jgi:hypothetical protein
LLTENQDSPRSTEVVEITIEKTATLVATTLATSPTTPSPAPTQAPSLVPSVITVTQNGTTITSTASVTPSPDAVFGQASSPPNGSNAGKITGIAIGAAVGLAIIIGLAFWLYLRRRGRGQFLPGTPESDVGDVDKGLPTRHASQMSQAGLIDKNPRVITTGLPTGSNPHSAGTGFSQNPNYRYSAPTDLRLNPSLLYAQVTAQHSSVSLQDNRDYSRQLHVSSTALPIIGTPIIGTLDMNSADHFTDSKPRLLNSRRCNDGFASARETKPRPVNTWGSHR